MNIASRFLTSTRRWFNQVTLTVSNMRHAVGATGWLLLNRTRINYAREVVPDANSIVIACVRWVQRTYSEAPLMLQEWLEDREEYQDHHRDPILDLLNKPNRFYTGTTLSKATVADYMLDGNSYWLMARNQLGVPAELWWAPSSTMEPKGTAETFITHYEYTANGTKTDLRPEDVIHFRDGMDPTNLRKGLSPLKSLLREIFTDNEACEMTNALLRNTGIPSVIIAPKTGTIDKDTADRMKSSYMEKTQGDNRGEPLFLQGDSTVTQVGFSPEQMGGRGLRGVPEERITAVLGVNAAVVGLGAGLATTKVGATLREYREEAFESTVIPMYREMALELTCQFVGNFRDITRWRLAHDLTKIRVLQEDEMNRTQRVTNLVTQGLILVAEGRRMLGLPVEEEHNIYLRPANLRQIPAGPLRVQTNPQPTTEQALALRRDAERLEAVLESRLTDPDVDVRTVLGAHYLLVAESTCIALSVEMPEGLGNAMLSESSARGSPVNAETETSRAQELALEILRGNALLAV